MSDPEAHQFRTPLALTIKTLTTHAFALATYAYASTLLRRPTKPSIQALRLLFFAFVPTLPLVEILYTALRSLTQFLQNYEDSDDIHLAYYLSGALGLHASRSQDDDDKDAKDRARNVEVLDVGSHCAERKKRPIDWVWAGKMLASLFSLAQAVGTIVMWVRRMHVAEEASAHWGAGLRFSHSNRTLGLDHRNGAMGIASAICNCVCIFALLLRQEWKVSKSFEGAGNAGTAQQVKRFAAEAAASVLLHLFIATMASAHNRWMYTSAGVVLFLASAGQIGYGGDFLARGWQTMMLVVFLVVFRNELAQKFGLRRERFVWIFQSRQGRRVKALVSFSLVSWVVADIIVYFISDIIEVVKAAGDDHPWGAWWQDPISDAFPVI